MRCQFCNKEKTDRIFYINWMGTVYQVPVCQDCLQKMWQKAAASGRTEEFRNYTGWWPGKQEPRHMGDRAFPDQAVSGLVMRRKLAALKAKLTEAANAENYEEAARLRDDIATMEKEVCTNGN
ncbi:MAG TPA: UvrB/UvrC motif-containing protein [Candidatus Pullilachnospira intestinigallinarum]|nr:UvrB/UvrC motif-containing protein [Candidatus Pullilachnospira intestinigallinarum]